MACDLVHCHLWSLLLLRQHEDAVQKRIADLEAVVDTDRFDFENDETNALYDSIFLPVILDHFWEWIYKYHQ